MGEDKKKKIEFYGFIGKYLLKLNGIGKNGRWM